MNYSMIAYIIGWIFGCEGVLLVPSLITALIYREKAGFSILITIGICLLLGFPLMLRKPKNPVFYAKEGFVTVALSWIMLSIIGSLPFVISGYIPHLIDAIFETVSGFTTTGASILSDIEALPHCLLFWRSFTHWIGGMGVLVFLLTVIPLAGGYQMNLMRAESPGPSVEKLAPKVRSTATKLYEIYLFMTILEILLLLGGGMPLFDSLTLTFGTAGTGGFGIFNDSIGSYSSYCQIVITIFMILFGVNFSVYFLILTKHIRQALLSEELRWYLGIILVSILVITVNIRNLYPGIGTSLKHAAFQVSSIITTTGYSTTDFDLWPELSKHILVVLMFFGACAGSTGGGIKISRLVILCKSVKRELNYFLHPRSVSHVTMDGKPVAHNTIRTINAFMAAYIAIFIVSVLIVSLDGQNGVTSFTAVAATLNNIGPGLAGVGPTFNFGFFSYGAKLVLIFDMLAGRLEIFPLFLLFYPATWKKF